MRLDNLAILNTLTLDDLEYDLDHHTLEIVEPDRWTMFNWSVSRHHMFEECKRRYYLNYYGARRVRDARSRVVSAIWWLKQVRSIQMWTGTVIHHIAQEAVRAHATGGTIDAGALVDHALKYYREGLAASARGAKHGSEWIILFDDVYKDEATAALREQGEATIERMTHALLDSEAIGFIRTNPPEAVLEIDEEFQSFQLDGVMSGGSLTVFAIPDVLLASGGDYYLIDWKTGDIAREGIHEQAGVYRYYVHHRYGAPEESIHVAISDVGGDGGSTEPPGGVPSVAETFEFIKDSAGAMLSRLDDETYNTAAIKDFPMTEDVNLCRTCGFKRACWREG